MVENHVKEDLRRRGIRIEDLWISPSGSVEELFDPSARYTSVELFPRGAHEPDPGIPGLVTMHGHGSVKVCGSRRSYLREKSFEVYLSFFPSIAVPLDETKILSIDNNLKELEAYFQLCMEAQQPKYSYTYRSRTEIK